MATITNTTAATITNTETEGTDPRLLGPKGGKLRGAKLIAAQKAIALAEVQAKIDAGIASEISPASHKPTTAVTENIAEPIEEPAEKKEPPMYSIETPEGRYIAAIEKKRQEQLDAANKAVFHALNAVNKTVEFRNTVAGDSKELAKAEKQVLQARNRHTLCLNNQTAAEKALASAEKKAEKMFTDRDEVILALAEWTTALNTKTDNKDKQQKLADVARMALVGKLENLLESAPFLGTKEAMVGSPATFAQMAINRLSSPQLEVETLSISSQKVKVAVAVAEVKEKPSFTSPPTPKVKVSPQAKAQAKVDEKRKAAKEREAAELSKLRGQAMMEASKAHREAHDALVELMVYNTSDEAIDGANKLMTALGLVKSSVTSWINLQPSPFDGHTVDKVVAQCMSEIQKVNSFVKKMHDKAEAEAKKEVDFLSILKPCGYGSEGAAFESHQGMLDYAGELYAEASRREDAGEGFEAIQSLSCLLVEKARNVTHESLQQALDAARDADKKDDKEVDWDAEEAKWESSMEDLQDAHYSSGMSSVAPEASDVTPTETIEEPIIDGSSNPTEKVEEEKEEMKEDTKAEKAPVVEMDGWQVFLSQFADLEEGVLLGVLCTLGKTRGIKSVNDLSAKEKARAMKAAEEEVAKAIAKAEAGKKIRAEREVKKEEEAAKKAEAKVKKEETKGGFSKEELLQQAYHAAFQNQFTKASGLLRKAGIKMPWMSTDDFVVLSILDAFKMEGILAEGDEAEMFENISDEWILGVIATNESIFKRTWSRTKGGVKKAVKKVKGFFRKEGKEPKAEAEAEQQEKTTRFERAKRDLAEAGKDVLMGGAFVVGGVAIAAACAVGAPICGVGAAWSLIRGRKDEAKARIKKAGMCLAGVGVGAVVSVVGVAVATLVAAADLLSSTYNAIVGGAKAIGSFFKGLFGKKSEAAVVDAAVAV